MNRLNLKRATGATFIPGGFSYWRGTVLMVEVSPGRFVSAETAITFGITPVNPPKKPESR